jgi:methyl-accepting chemotaxis protein
MTTPVRAEAKLATGIRERRKRKPLSLAFQLRALLPVFIYGGLLVALTLAFVWLPFQHDIAADPSPVVKAILSAQLLRLELSLAPFLLISGGVAAVFALLRARRIAAPVRDLQEHLAKLALGDAEPLALEPRDEFRELEAPFNGVLSRVDQMSRTNLEMLRLLRRNLEGISQRSTDQRLTDADLRESVAVLLRDIDAEIKKLQMRS